ncbi:hypothetical protein [Tomitella biformata]|uniref:hypothetical protein n=1 Tax=Tomitella biformata TaxID=630403 RepID=UPI00046468B1|nr:hypothetical protein [Tomitella biformata]
MSSQVGPHPELPQPAAIAVGAAAVLVGGIERTARSFAGPLWQLARRLPGAAAPLDSAIGALAETGTAVAQRTRTLAETLTRQLLRAVVPMVFEELAALERLDLTWLVLKHVDLDAIAAEIDIDAIITRLDLLGLVHQVIRQLDLTTLVLDQVDLDKIITGVDLDAAVHQVDLLGLANEIIDGVNLTEIIRESTGALSTDAVRGVRTRGVDADAAVSGFVDRLLGRDSHPDQSGGGA